MREDDLHTYSDWRKAVYKWARKKKNEVPRPEMSGQIAGVDPSTGQQASGNRKDYTKVKQQKGSC